MNQNGAEQKHYMDQYLREDRIPHIWCPGCGIGSAFSACITALQKTGIDYNRFAIVSGIGCFLPQCNPAEYSGRGASGPLRLRNLIQNTRQIA